MPRPKQDERTETAAADATEETLVPFSVILDGQDRTFFAKDEADLQLRLAKLRSTSPLNDGQ